MAALVGTEDISEAPDLAAVIIGLRWVVVCTIIPLWAAECGTGLLVTEDAAAACSP